MEIKKRNDNLFYIKGYTCTCSFVQIIEDKIFLLLSIVISEDLKSFHYFTQPEITCIHVNKHWLLAV